MKHSAFAVAALVASAILLNRAAGQSTGNQAPQGERPLAAESQSRAPGRGQGGGQNAVMRAIDTDGDGELSAAEIAAVPNQLSKLDSNGDGKLTRDEVRSSEGRSAGRGGQGSGGQGGRGQGGRGQGGGGQEIALREAKAAAEGRAGEPDAAPVHATKALPPIPCSTPTRRHTRWTSF